MDLAGISRVAGVAVDNEIAGSLVHNSTSTEVSSDRGILP